MNTITSWWHAVKDAVDPPRTVSAQAVLPRYRETPSGAFPALAKRDPPAPEIKPDPMPAAPMIAPPSWSLVFPGHYKALCDDLRRRGEDPDHWECTDGKDLGVDENGHTVAFTLRKTGTSAAIVAALTLCRGKVATIRVH